MIQYAMYINGAQELETYHMNRRYLQVGLLVAPTASLVSVSSIFPPVAVVVVIVASFAPIAPLVAVVAASLIGLEAAAGVVSA